MSNPLSSIRAAFVTKLQAFTGLPAVAWENVPYTPTVGTPYIKPMLIMAEPFQAEIGAAGINRYNGIYQISVYVPSGSVGTPHQGVAAMNTLAANLCDHFKRGTKLTYSTTTVTIQKAYTIVVFQETDWIHIPVTIQWRSDAAN